MDIRVRVHYFAEAREAAGTGSEEYSLPGGSSLETLVTRSMRAHQELRRVSKGMRIAVNEEIAGEGVRLSDGDVVAFLPPVAGG